MFSVAKGRTWLTLDTFSNRKWQKIYQTNKQMSTKVDEDRDRKKLRRAYSIFDLSFSWSPYFSLFPFHWVVHNWISDQEMPAFDSFLTTTIVGSETIKFYDLRNLGDKFNRLPFSIRVLLESAVRNCDEFQVPKFKVDIFSKEKWENLIVYFEQNHMATKWKHQK